MANESNEFNFLPDDYCERSVRRRLSAAGIAILAIFAIATIVATYVSEQSLVHVVRYNAEVKQDFDRACLRSDRADALRHESEQLLRSCPSNGSLGDRNPVEPDSFGVECALPSDAWLSNVNIQSVPRSQAANATPTAFDLKKAALESKRGAGADMLPETPATDIVARMSGLSDTNAAISRFCENLSRSSAFKNVQLINSEICAVPGKEKNVMRRFQIEATVSPTPKVRVPAQESFRASTTYDETDAVTVPAKETP